MGGKPLRDKLSLIICKLCEIFFFMPVLNAGFRIKLDSEQMGIF